MRSRFTTLYVENSMTFPRSNTGDWHCQHAAGDPEDRVAAMTPAHPDLSDPDSVSSVAAFMEQVKAERGTREEKLKLPPTEVMYRTAMERSDEIKRNAQRDKARQYDEQRAAAVRIARALDLAVLKPTAGRRDVEAACALVNQHGIASICVASSFVPIAGLLTPRVCSVIGFPHGNASVTAKVHEAGEALYHGAVELDVVVSYGRFIEGNPDPVVSELTQIVNIAHTRHAIVKAILETCCLSLPQIADLCRLCADCGVDYVKTSTGFSTGGADTVGVACMISAVGGRCLIKASGGIDCYDKAKTFLDMGCARIGSSKYLELLPSWG